MAYHALYRKWRPTTFDMVVGQTATVSTLRHQIQTGQITHAYLFCGCRGTGKTTLAKLMSRAINCENTVDGEPCGTCAICQAILTETTMDVLEIDAASHSGVDNIRELLDQVRYPPQLGRYKVYIIDEVHMLSNAAFNALLKTLEEPPPHVVFILATTEPQKLPATILSRVQRYDFGRIPTAFIVERLQLVLDDLQIKAEKEALAIVARSAEGAMRDALSILDMCVAGAKNQTITAAQVRDLLGTCDRSFLFSFVDGMAKRDAKSVMQGVDSLMRTGREPIVFLRELSAHMRNLLTVEAISEDVTDLLDISKEDEEQFRTQAKTFTNGHMLRILDLLIKAESEIRYASTPRIGLELTLLRTLEENRATTDIALLERLEEAEKALTTLQQNIAQGTLSLAPSSAKAPKTPKENSAPKAPPAPPKPVLSLDDKQLWQKCLNAVLAKDPILYSLLCKMPFLGVKDDVFTVSVSAEKNLQIQKLSDEKNKQQLSEILSETVGRPVRFAPQIISSPPPKDHTASKQSLIDAFGRENVEFINNP